MTLVPQLRATLCTGLNLFIHAYLNLRPIDRLWVMEYPVLYHVWCIKIQLRCCFEHAVSKQTLLSAWLSFCNGCWIAIRYNEGYKRSEYVSYRVLSKPYQTLDQCMHCSMTSTMCKLQVQKFAPNYFVPRYSHISIITISVIDQLVCSSDKARATIISR